VVWTDTRASNADIFYWDVGLGSGQVICNYMSTQTNADISGDLVVWQDVRGGFNNIDIYGYDLSGGGEFQVTTDTSHQQCPAVSGRRVVYQDKRNGSWDIYMKDLDTSVETPICTGAGDQTEPAIDGDLIVWTDARSGNSDIYGYDLSLSAERPVCVHDGQQVHPDVSQGRIVWADDRNGHWDIYSAALPTPSVLSSGYVTPDTGNTSIHFTYRVKYWNTGGFAADSVWIAIWSGWSGAARWYEMWEYDAGDTDVTDGKWYTLSCYLDGSAHAYRFAAQCGYEAAYWPVPAGGYASGPAVDPVTLSSGYVMPGSGSGGGEFTYRIKYWSGVNAAPLSVWVAVWSPSGTTWHQMWALDPADTNYRDGKWYTYRRTLAAGTYAYRFSVHAPDKWYAWPLPSGSYRSGPSVGG
jgi:beta propeller repeat protein